MNAAPDSRFRLTSLEATEVCERLSRLWSEAPRRLVPHLHAPLQSGSDRLLKRMGRHWYTAASYARAVDRLARAMPVFALGADLITGFPGEREVDHRATVDLVRALPFTYLHVFPYSARPGTAAQRLGDAVPPDEASRRALELRKIGDGAGAAYRASRAGGRADVVIIPSGGRREGLTEDYLTVGLDDTSVPRGARVDGELAVEDGALIARLTRSRNSVTVSMRNRGE